MKVSRTVVWACLAAAGMASVSGQKLKNERDEDQGGCREISASGASVSTTENCSSPLRPCTDGTIRGEEFISGLMHAATVGVTPALGLSGVEPETSLSLAGNRTLTTAHGILKFRFITVFDSARGEFAEIDRVTGGTENFKEATGTLWFTGTGTRATGFNSTITGRICTNRTVDRN